jgi:outer membrane protein, multidrug efflux system
LAEGWGAERPLTAATSAQEAAQPARLRFDPGVTDFLIVLDAEREVLNNRDQLAQAQTDTATVLVGGWAAPVAQ